MDRFHGNDSYRKPANQTAPFSLGIACYYSTFISLCVAYKLIYAGVFLVW